METIRQMARDIVHREGGFVNDPADPGGATNHGVTLATLRRLGLDVDKDGKISISDVKNLSSQQAEDIFLQHYFAAPGIGDLPDRLQATVFDMFVNAGANAVRILQQLLNDMGANVGIDGLIGPETALAAANAMRLAPNHLVDAYGIARRNYYYQLADARPKLRKFARRRDGGKGGWIRRAETFISPRFHLSEAGHRQRTASWD